MSEFKKYIKKNITEMRAVNSRDCRNVHHFKRVFYSEYDTVIRISKDDSDNGSPKFGDMIARNPDNPRDQWLVAKEYFDNNFEKLNPPK